MAREREAGSISSVKKIHQHPSVGRRSSISAGVRLLLGGAK
jgi:hypothetical protein